MGDAVCWRERLPTLSVVRLQIPVLGTMGAAAGIYIKVGIEVRFASLITLAGFALHIMSYIVATTTGIMSSATRNTVMRAGVRHWRMVFCICFPTTVGED